MKAVQRSAVEAFFFNHNKDGRRRERSVDYAIKTVSNKLGGIFSRKEGQMTALKAFVEEKHIFSVAQSPDFIAMIGCRPIQLRPEAFWSVPVWDAL